ncbi:MAG TPA: MogA/MoaB family molybdenum cofactor biosynthesis protein [Methanomicrobia archaeon]|nr:MogA/MoaB family molybdenum cofactor biosynthesis protein [Methanomicrobia archaeon]
MSIPEKHKKGAKKKFKCAVLTVSTSKFWRRERGESEEEVADLSGKIAKELVARAGHEVVFYDLLPDEEEKIKEGVSSALKSGADFVVTSGGTGLTKSDLTIEVVSRLLEKEMPGVGEIFRLKSYETAGVGTAAVLSRAVAGVVGQKAVFCLPGSPDAVRLALSEIILPEIGHILKHARE